MVIGAHFDIAPIIAPTPVDMGAPRGYGTRVGAYDNTVGTSVVLNMAEAMFDIPTRRGIVFCLWSSEKEVKEVVSLGLKIFLMESQFQIISI